MSNQAPATAKPKLVSATARFTEDEKQKVGIAAAMFGKPQDQFIADCVREKLATIQFPSVQPQDQPSAGE